MYKYIYIHFICILFLLLYSYYVCYYMYIVALYLVDSIQKIYKVDYPCLYTFISILYFFTFFFILVFETPTQLHLNDTPIQDGLYCTYLQLRT